MGVQITIRNVPGEVRDILASRAARRGQSMQEYLRLELERVAARPSVDDVIEAIRRRKEQSDTTISARRILAARDSGRKE